jgi:hypothetical protein
LKAFQVCLNNSGLLWTFSDRANEEIFWDLRLKIEGRKVVTSLYAKPLALHLYLPPHSCHAPGVLSGLIFGNVLCIHQLCSAAADIKKELKLFFHCLLDHGYQPQKINPLFQQAIDNATVKPLVGGSNPYGAGVIPHGWGLGPHMSNQGTPWRRFPA